MIHRIEETIEMKDLPTWLQELWEQNPSLARRAEKHYLELTEQCNIANVVGQSEQLPDSYRTELLNVKQLMQTQASLDEQLQILRPFANKLGLYDAADYLLK